MSVATQKFWAHHYPKGVPAEVNLREFNSLAEVLNRSVSQFGPDVAFINMGQSLTYHQLDQQSTAFAAYLQTQLQLSKGSRVALMMPNLLQYPICLFGAIKAGYTVVNCNPLYTEHELEHQLKDSGASVVVILENFAHVLEKVLERISIPHVIVTQIGDMLPFAKKYLVNSIVRYVKKMIPPWSIPQAIKLPQVLRAGAHLSFVPPALNQDDLAFLQYTGGTTGVSKGAMLSHGNIIANLQQAHAWLGPILKTKPKQLIVTALPLYHIFALTANCLTFMKIGATNLLITNPRDIPSFIKELARYPFTAITVVNTLFNALLHHPDFARLNFQPLCIALGGGMAVQPAVASKWKEVTGTTLIEAYGLTETSPAVTINPMDLKEFNGCIGLPVPSTDVCIRDEDGRDLPPGSAGELCVRGPQVMKGYWNRPDETRQVMMPDGFLRTGDIAIMDAQGYCKIVDRKKDMILVSGFNVYPNEVESVAAMHPMVLEAAAVGFPSDATGEAVRLFVVKKSHKLTEAMLLEHMRQHLTPYKIPHEIVFRTDLPKTNVGKILRRALRQ